MRWWMGRGREIFLLFTLHAAEKLLCIILLIDASIRLTQKKKRRELKILGRRKANERMLSIIAEKLLRP
jgi:hypothetical protein